MRNYFQEPPEVPESNTTRRSRRKETSVRIQDPPISKTKEVNQEERLERTKDRNQGKSKGKLNIEAIYQNSEPSQKEDHQTLSERLVYLLEQAATTKKKRKEKKSKEEDTSPQHVRRSTRLKG